MARGTFEAKPAGNRASERHRHDSGRPPATPDTIFWAVFEHAPDAYLLLAADPPRFTMVAANEARLRVTMTRREDVIGRPLFEVFPDNPNDPAATGVRNLQASLQEVLRTRKRHRMPLQKYDIRRPDRRFEERYWDPLNSPVFDEEGNLVYIIHRVDDVTEFVHLRKRELDQEKLAQRLLTRGEHMEAEILRRAHDGVTHIKGGAAAHGKMIKGSHIGVGSHHGNSIQR